MSNALDTKRLDLRSRVWKKRRLYLYDMYVRVCMWMREFRCESVP